MKIAILLLTSLLITISGWAQADDYREFTNLSGQTMRAKPVSVVGDMVRIQREDGQEFNVSTTIFEPKDKAFLDQWMITKLVKTNRLLKVNAKEDGTRKDKTGDDAMTYYKWDGFYKLEIENKSDLPLQNLRISYTYYIFDDDMAADKKKDGRERKVSGKLDVKLIGAHKKTEMETERTRMQETKLGSGWYYTDGGSRSSKDRLEGIRLKIYQGDLLLVDYAEPKSLREEFAK